MISKSKKKKEKEKLTIIYYTILYILDTNFKMFEQIETFYVRVVT